MSQALTEQPTRAFRHYFFPAIAFVGAAWVVIGSLGPWGTFTSFYGDVSINGTSGDGKLTLILGIGIAIAMLLAFSHPRLGYTLTILESILVIVIAGDHWNNMAGLVDGNIKYVVIEIKWGLYLVLVGGCLALSGAIIHFAWNRDAPKTG
jgi:hypothetical protein